MRKRKIIGIAAVAMVLLLTVSCIRVIRPQDQSILLFRNPFHLSGGGVGSDFHLSGGSVGSDIRADFDAAGKPSDKIISIDYVGSNGGNYFVCQYDAGDGGTERYYAYDDGDLNSSVRAKVLWP